MICKNCNAEFPRRMTIDGIERDFKKRTNCLDCTPFKTNEVAPQAPHPTPENRQTKPKQILSLNQDKEEEYIIKEVSDKDLNYHFKAYNTGRVELVTNVPIKLVYDPNGVYDNFIFDCKIKDYKKTKEEIVRPYLNQIEVLRRSIASREKPNVDINIDNSEDPDSCPF